MSGIIGEAVASSTPAQPAPTPLIEAPGPDGSLLVHRPERVFPVLPPTAPVPLTKPPAKVDPNPMGAWTLLMPVLGSLTLVAFAVLIRNPVYIAVAGVIVLAMVGGVLGTRAASKRKQERRAADQRRAWLGHLARASEQATLYAGQQRDAQLGTHPAPTDLLTTARDQGAVWERRLHHADFVTVRLGTGDVAARRPLALPDRDESNVDEDADLWRLAEETAQRQQTVTGAPVLTDLASLSSLAVVSGSGASDVLGSLVSQLAAGCSPADLQVLGWVAPERAPRWDWCKWLPHTRDPLRGEGFGRATRAVGTDASVFADHLTRLVAEREAVTADRPETDARRRATPHVVVVVDAYHPRHPVATAHLETLLAQGRAMRVSVLLAVEEPSQVPGHCDARLLLEDDFGGEGAGTAVYVESGAGGRVETAVQLDSFDRGVAEDLARWLAPRRTGEEAGARASDTIRLAEMLGVDDVTDLDPRGRHRGTSGPVYTAGRPEDLLVAPIGVAHDGSPLRLDLKESALGGSGPHGVMVGATGSGKSELLRTIVAGLAATHPADLLNVLAVDFKGGAAFSELATLPHMVGVVTNLADDHTLIDRVQASLSGELRRRQALLRDAGRLDDITEYQQAAAERRLEPMPHLLVVVDEFSELLSARPEFLDTFVAIGRLGRSLGIHLLLATQRLEEGRLRGLESHLRYRIGLRTFSAQESTQILGSPAAYELPPLPGLGYLKVDTAMTRFKAAISTVGYRPAQRVNSRAPAVARPFALDEGTQASVPADRGLDAPPDSDATELSVLVDLLCAQGGRPARQVWLPPLPDAVTLGALAERAAARTGHLVGLVDDPDGQRQDPFVLDPGRAGGHLAMVGAPQSGKSTFLRTLALCATRDHPPTGLQVYGIDFGGGGLAPLTRLPHTGAVAGRHEIEAVRRVLADVAATLDERATACRAAGVSTLAELRRRPDADALLPHPRRADVLLLIDNVGLLRSELPDDEFRLSDLASTCLPYGIHLAVTAGRWLDIRPALLDSISTRLELRLNEPSDSHVSRQAAKQLPRIAGRALITGGRHMQVALPQLGAQPEPDGENTAFGAVATAWERQAPGVRAPRVMALPTRIAADDVPDLAAAAGRPVIPSDGHGQFLLGLHEHRLAPVGVDLLAPGQHLLAYGDQQTGKTTLLRRAVGHLTGARSPDALRLHLVDVNRGLLDLADLEHVDHYCFTSSQVESCAQELFKVLLDRLPPPDLPTSALAGRDWWHGPEQVLVVDDYQLLLQPSGGPLASLVDPLAHARDLGFHVLLARTVGGSARTAFEPFGQRLREVTSLVAVLPGDRGEGPLAAGITAQPGPPGRAQIARPAQRTALVQLLADETGGTP